MSAGLTPTLGLLCVLGAVASASGAEGARAEKAEEPAGIAKAKQALDAVKASATARTAAGPDALPAFDLPTLNSAPPEPMGRPPVDAVRRLDLGARKPAWVVPAAARREQSTGGAGRSDEIPARGVGGHESFDVESNRDRNEESRTSDLASNSGGVRSGKASNPLQPFLTRWISPQDHTLLGATQQLETSATAWAPRLGAGEGALAPGVFAAESPAGMPRQPVATLFADGAPPRPPANPYLEGISGSVPISAPPVAQLPAPGVPAAPAAPARWEAPRNEPASTPARAPDFVRPTADDRYFKPLKRF